jgi:hypothetical protein
LSVHVLVRNALKDFKFNKEIQKDYLVGSFIGFVQIDLKDLSEKLLIIKYLSFNYDDSRNDSSFKIVEATQQLFIRQSKTGEYQRNLLTDKLIYPYTNMYSKDFLLINNFDIS